MKSATSVRLNAEMVLQANAEIEQNQSLVRSFKHKDYLPAFITARYLNNIELNLEKKKGKSLIPFFWTMSSLSPYYAAVFQKAQELKIRQQPTPHNSLRLVKEFHPQDGVMNIPQYFKDELSWYLDQPITDQLFSHYSTVTTYGFGIHHEALHLILYRLIPPPKKKDLSEYLFFIESLVMVHEFVLAYDLGPYVTKTLRTLGLCYGSYHKAHAETWKKNPKQAFLATFVAYVGVLNQWPLKKIKAHFPQYRSFIKENRTAYFVDTFVEESTPAWVKTAKFKKFKSLPLHGHQPLLLKEFSVESLTPQRLEQIWNWICQNLYDPS